MKTATSTPTRTGTSADTLNQQLSDLAQRQLDSLRDALEVRLSALEAVLADPNRGESLEGLILDLARVATEEAQAAATKACVDAKVDADTQLAATRASAQEMVEQQRAINEELHRAVEQMQQQLASLEASQRNELQAARDELVGQLTAERERAAQFERVAAEAQQHIEAERAAVADVRRAALRAEERVTALEREKGEAWAAHEHVSTQYARERQAVEDLQRSQAETESQLEAERASIADLRHAAELASGTSKVLAGEKADALAAQEQLAAQLAREREANESLQRAHTDAQAQLEAERAESADLRRAAEDAQERLTTLAPENAQVIADHDALARELARERQSAAALHGELAELQTQLEAERSAGAELREAAELVEARLSSVVSDNVQTLANQEALQVELTAAQSEAAHLRAELDAARSGQGSDADRQKAEVTWREAEARLEAVVRERDALQAELHDARQRASHPLASSAAPAAARPPKRETKHAPGSPADEGWTAVRLANRYAFGKPIEVQVNGESGLLFDLSITGCQLLAPAGVKPNQVVKVMLPAEDAAIACTGKVMWARLEPPAAGRPLGYRAGVQFTKPDQNAIEAFVAVHVGNG